MRSCSSCPSAVPLHLPTAAALQGRRHSIHSGDLTQWICYAVKWIREQCRHSCRKGSEAVRKHQSKSVRPWQVRCLNTKQTGTAKFHHWNQSFLRLVKISSKVTVQDNRFMDIQLWHTFLDFSTFLVINCAILPIVITDA